MKLFTDFINEEFTEYRIKDVKVVFDVEPSEITFEIPEGYGDSELTIYLGDRFLKSLPADESVGKTKLGINYENINDAYFEYESVEFIDNTDSDIDFEFDPHYDEKMKDKNKITAKVKKLKYIILFDIFVLKKDQGQNVHDIVDRVFNIFDSSTANKYPLTIKYNRELTEYTEE